MIIGITGTAGAGKGTVVEYLKKKGFRHISARSVWTKELEARELPVDRDHMTALANQLRAEHGAAYFMEQALTSVSAGESVAIESVRAIAEADMLKKAGGVLLAVTADQKIRYERIHARGSALDDVSFADFVRQEEAELQNEDPNKQNIAQVMTMADYTIFNDNHIEKLYADIEAMLNSIQAAQ